MCRSYILLSLFLVALLLSSCNNDEMPLLEVYVSSEDPDFYSSVRMDIFALGMYHEDGGHYSKGVFHENGNIEFSNGENTFLIKNGQFNEGRFNQFWLSITNVFATAIDGSTTIIVDSRDATSCLLDLDFELLPNQRYRIDIIFDLDKSILITGQNASFQSVAEIKIEEL